jgi:hypothetical protein
MGVVPLKELIHMEFNGIQIPLKKQIYRYYRLTHYPFIWIGFLAI